MTFTPIRKFLSNRHISISAVAVLTTACFPLAVNATPTYVTNANYSSATSTITFDFKGCGSRGNDTICGGILRNNSVEQPVRIMRHDPYIMLGGGSTSITDSNGGTHIASKISLSGSPVCDESCGGLTDKILVQGVNYKVLIVFKDTSLSSSRIPLLEIGGLDFKARNINVQNSNSQNNRPQQTVSNNGGGSGQRNYSSRFSPYRSGPDQIVLAGLNPGASYYIQGNLSNGYQQSKRILANACGEIFINRTSTIRSLAINGRMLDIINLPEKSYQRCSG
jgi:hypothetical protein